MATIENGHQIDKRDFDESRALLHSNSEDIERPHSTHFLEDDDSLLSNVAQGIVDRDRREVYREFIRYTSFVCAILSCLCAGSITAYSLYGHLFLSRLGYTQLKVNTVSIAAELSMYLPVPIFGYLCDRYSPSPLSLLSGVLFGFGYLLAAFTYRQGPNGWPFGLMVLAFTGIGSGTSCMYLSAVATCAKNFGRGKHKGLVLAIPIAAFGLSGMWQSQVGSHLLYEKTSQGTRGDVDVFRYFLFLAILLISVGLVGTFGLRIVDEDELIAEELERSGLLEDSPFLRRVPSHHSYSTLSPRAQSISSSRPSSPSSSIRKETKTLLLNHATSAFLRDPTMWLLAVGFFLVIGPGEAFINNIGTIIVSLYPVGEPNPTSAATHVSIIALTSTIARIVVGTISDLFAPRSESVHFPISTKPSKFSLTIPRPFWLLLTTFLLSLGLFLLSIGTPHLNAPALIPISALVGTGYGAAFTLTPILISCVWGVENFATNWGIINMVPAAGAALWGIVYSAVYQRGVDGENGDVCFGKRCYSPAFWGMTVSVWAAIVAFSGAVKVWRMRGVVV
ncbi:MAG: putative monocarboxylate transporter mch1 [Cirrosporium novae-zelandiae]|nr:MAG: putative monocarboxylate transporter mch1 [Cirrosporium novae-zelandiae]KAI9735568.1 MAG: putative monocarboxylate transporter mch1 [Cirrosporium novae-zelandiae]